MKKTLLHILALFVALTSGAQISISVDPGTSTASGLSTATDIVAYCHVTNDSPLPVSLLWSRAVVTQPHEWLSWVCDKTTCYLPFVNVCPDDRPNVLDPGASFELSYHINPVSVEGEAEFKVYFFDLSDPEVILDSVQFLMETSTTSVSDPTHSLLRIYPNPTTSYFQIQNPTEVAKVVVYNIVGNKMREFDARNQTRFDVAYLPEGIYLVRLLDSRQTVLKTVRLSKR